MAIAAINLAIPDEYLEQWSVWRGDRPSGTALFIFEPKAEIVVCVDPGITGNSDETDKLKQNLAATLMGFVDPYQEQPPIFGSQAHSRNKTTWRALSPLL